MANSTDHESAALRELSRDVEALCGFFRRRSRFGGGGRYELLQARGEVLSTKWGPVWTFEAQNNHAAEKAGWMARRLVDPQRVPVRHACRVLLRRHLGSTKQAVPEIVEVMVVTILPDRAQLVFLLASGTRVAGLPFLRCGGAEVVAVAMGLISPDKRSDDAV